MQHFDHNGTVFLPLIVCRLARKQGNFAFADHILANLEQYSEITRSPLVVYETSKLVSDLSKVLLFVVTCTLQCSDLYKDRCKMLYFICGMLSCFSQQNMKTCKSSEKIILHKIKLFACTGVTLAEDL